MPRALDATEPGAPPAEGSGEHSGTGHAEVTDHGDDRVGPSVAPGSTLGRYRVTEVLGRGGMGMVLRAHDPRLDRDVAIKLMRASTTTQRVERLRREAQALARLSHPNIVQVFEVGRADGRWFIAMELVEGQTLEAWRWGDHGWRACLDTYLQAGEGLAAAHAAGFVHRDFKPANCLIDARGRVRVVDFGLVRAVGASIESELPESFEPKTERLGGSLTRTGAILGTAAYMPLEQFAGEPADARSDQFSFCVALYEAMYGQRPFAGDTAAELVASLTRDTLQPEPAGCEVSVRVRAVLLRGLAKDPDERWPSMRALLDALRRATTPWHARTPARVAGVGLLGAGLFSVWFWGSAPGPRDAQEPTGCVSGTEYFEEHWGDAVRERTRRALLESGLVYAEDVWRGVAVHMDVFPEQWLAAQRVACETGGTLPSRGSADRDAMLACLLGQRAEFEQLVSIMGEGGETVVRHAVQAVRALPVPSECEQAPTESVLDPPEVLRARVIELRRDEGRITTLEHAGLYEQAAHEAEALLLAAEVVGFAPLITRATAKLGALESRLGRTEDAERHLSATYFAAQDQGQRALAVDAAVGLTMLHQANDITSARAWLRHAKTELERGEVGPRQHRGVDNAEGVVLLREGRYAEAAVRFEKLLESARAFGRSRGLARPLNNLAIAYMRQDDPRAAARHLRDLLAIRLEEVGPSHPYTIKAKSNLASVLVKGQRYAEAVELLQDARRALEASGEPGVVSLTHVMHGLGNAYDAQGDSSAATEAFEQAVELRRAAGMTQQIGHAHILNDYSVALSNVGQHERARQALEDALAIVEQVVGPNYEGAAGPILLNLADWHREQGDCQRAIEYYDRVEKIRIELHGDDSSLTANVRGGQALCLIELDRAALAEHKARRAIEVMDQTEGADEEYRARAHFALARVLWADEGARDQARTQAKRAQELLRAVSGGPDTPPMRREIRRWLRAHP